MSHTLSPASVWAAPGSSVDLPIKKESNEKADHRLWRACRRQPEHPDGRPTRPCPAARCVVPGKAGPLRPRSHPRAPHACQGFRRAWHVYRHARHHALHAGENLWRRGQANAHVRALFHGGRRTGRGGRGARYPRLCPEVLHGRRQLGPGRQQHARVLHARPAEIPRFEPRHQARPAHGPAQRQQQLGLLDLAARSAAPGDGGDERPGLAAQLPPHARLRQPYLQLPERAKRAFLGQVHL